VVAVNSGVEKQIREALEPFGYRLTITHDGKKAMMVLRKLVPDLIISEVDVPEVNGFDLCRFMKKEAEYRVIPFLLVTSFYNLEHKVKGFHVGVDDFLYYPFHELELRARVSSLLRIKHFYARLQSEKEHLDDLVRRRTKELEQLNLSLISALEGANRLKDLSTGNHVRRVSEYAAMLADGCGLDHFSVSLIRTYASLHDVGKIGLPDHILKKTGKLTTEEFEEMKRHTTFGYELLKQAGVSEVAQNIALCHHERWDGQGYPQRLTGNDIPVEARVVALADVYDALTTKRSYKEAMPLAEARERILFLSGRHFDPSLCDAFASIAERFDDVAHHFGDAEGMTEPAAAEGTGP
jgi:putative two-component system response regulator